MKIEKKYLMSVYKRDFSYFLKHYLIMLIQIITLSLQPIIMMKLVNSAVAREKNKEIICYAFIFFMLLIVKTMANVFYQKLNIKWKLYFEMHERRNIIKKYIYFSEGNEDAGDIDTILKKDIDEIVSYVQYLFLEYPASVVQFAILLIIIILIDYRLTLLIVFGNLLILIIQKKSNTDISKNGEEVRSLYSKIYGELTEISSNTNVVYELKADRYLINRFEKTFSELSKSLILKMNSIYKIMSIIDIVQGISQVLLFLVGSIMISLNMLTVGVLVSFLQYSSQILNIMNNILQFPIEKANKKASIDRIVKGVYDISFDDLINSQEKKLKNGRVVFKNVYFEYSPENKVLSNMNCCFDKGHLNIIYGHSGEGKSTIFKLLLKKYEDYIGNISISGVDIKKIERKIILKNMGYLPQDDLVFKDTIRENICLGREVSNDKIMDVCKKCEIYDDIMNMPGGFDTVLTPENLNVSGGQLKRILLSRLLIEDNNYILLDEPTSSLDCESRNHTMKIIRKLALEKTIIMITHDETLKTSHDKVFTFNNKTLVVS